MAMFQRRQHQQQEEVESTVENLEDEIKYLQTKIQRMTCGKGEVGSSDSSSNRNLKTPAPPQTSPGTGKIFVRAPLVVTNTGSGDGKGSQPEEGNSGVDQQRIQELESIVQKQADEIKFLHQIFQIMKSAQNEDLRAASGSVSCNFKGKTGGSGNKNANNSNAEVERESEQVHLDNVRLFQKFMAGVTENKLKSKEAMAAEKCHQNELNRQQELSQQELALADHHRMGSRVAYWVGFGIAVVVVAALFKFYCSNF